MTTVRVQARYNMHKCESHASSALLLRRSGWFHRWSACWFVPSSSN